MVVITGAIFTAMYDGSEKKPNGVIIHIKRSGT